VLPCGSYGLSRTLHFYVLHTFSAGKAVAALDAEVQKQRAETAKQRHFAEQQRRLQQYGSHGARRLNADTLIESILGKSESPRQPVASTTAAETPTNTSSSSTIGL